MSKDNKQKKVDTAKTFEATESKFRLSGDYAEADLADLTNATYMMSPDTLKPHDKIDLAMTFCGGFSVICLIILIIRGFKVGFGTQIIVMGIIYIILAAALLPKPLQYRYYRFFWKRSIRNRLNPARSIIFTPEGLAFRIGKKMFSYTFEEMNVIYKFKGYFIFQITSSRIITVKCSSLNISLQAIRGELSGEEYLDQLLKDRIVPFNENGIVPAVSDQQSKTNQEND